MVDNGQWAKLGFCLKMAKDGCAAAAAEFMLGLFG